MELLVGLVLGITVVMLVKNKTFRIEITHRYEAPQTEDVPKMSDVMNKSDAKEDGAYDDMETVIDEINKMMNGGE